MENNTTENNTITFGDLFRDIAEVDYKSGKKKIKLTHEITDLGVMWIEDNKEFVREASISYLPMVIPPMDWVSPSESGGYFDPAVNKNYNLVKSMSRKDLSKLYETHSAGYDVLMRAINTLQKTSYRINNTVLDAARFVNENKINLDRKGLPTFVGGWVEVLGAEKANEYFEVKRGDKADMLAFIKTLIEDPKGEMTEKDFWKEWSNITEQSVKHSRGDRSKQILVGNTLAEAAEFEDEDELYFVYNADYRGRVYPLAGSFSPQGSDVARGLLEFSNGVELNPEEDHDAIRQIMIQAANNFGEDKVSLDARVVWAMSNEEEMVACAEDFESNDLWMKADKPFLFLLTCAEIKRYVDARDNGETFVSRLPIAFDGSCNGIQNFSAMFRDSEGAVAVNLTNK